MNIEKTIQTAYDFIKNGDLQKAEHGLKRVLEKKPNHPEALRSLGIILIQLGKYQVAIDIIRKDIRLNPANADSYNNLGLSFSGLGQEDEASKWFQKAIQINPKHYHAFYNLANSYKKLKQLDQAIECYKQAISFNPNFTEAYSNLGDVYQERFFFDEAIQSYRSALRVNPNLGNIYNNLGLALYKKGREEEAFDYFKKALNLNPGLADAYNNIGNYFFDKQDLEQSIKNYTKALQLDKSYATYNNLGNALKEKGLLNEAIICYQKALNTNQNAINTALNLGDTLRKQGKYDEALVQLEKIAESNQSCPEVYVNIGIVLQEKGLLQEAFKYYQNALVINPDIAEGYSNLGLAFLEKGEYSEALSNVYKAIKIKPTLANTHFNLAMLLLLEGNFQEGWKEYEWRWEAKDFISLKFNFNQPLWDGNNLSGDRILLHTEQGLGDAIQFMRYIPLVSSRNLKVVFRCYKEVIPLVKNSYNNIEIVAFDDPMPDFDMHCPLMSLPLIFNTTLVNIPADIPYISADKSLSEKWKQNFHNNTNFKIGIVWSGNPKYKRDRQRSCSLGTLSPLSQIKGVALYSLQKGTGSEQAKKPPDGMIITDLTEGLRDFGDTAAAIENLDLVISVDTAVAHLAGAMGKPVWTLLPFVPDWRWMLNRENSPWYPTMRLFRQPSPGDWDSVISRVKEELLKILV